MKLEGLAAINQLRDLAAILNTRQNRPSVARMQQWAVLIWNACTVIDAQCPDDPPSTPTDPRDRTGDW